MRKSNSQETFPIADLSNVHLGPRRLSKPRTNKSSSSLLSEQPTTPLSPHNSPNRDYFGKDAVVGNSHGERRSRSKSRGRITASSIMPLQSAKASAKRLSNSSSSGLLSTHSTESQAVDPEESAMIADQIKQRAYHDSLAAQNHVSTPVDEDRHVDSFMAPLRRKSLYTPGIATRNASDILRKPPKPSTDHDYYYDPSRPETSPLPNLAASSIGEDGRATPSDLHYSQLGGLQLGTLRVTNGASSPVLGSRPPDLAYRPATPDSKTHDEYYTASEGSVTGDGDHATPLPPRGGSPLRYESRIEASTRTDNRVPSSPDKSLPFERGSSNESFPFSREEEIVDHAAHFEGGATDQLARFRRETPSDIFCGEEGTSTANNLFFFENGSRDDIEHFQGKTSKEPFPLKMDLPKTCHVEGGKPNESCSSKREKPDEPVCFVGKTLSESFPVKTRSTKACSVEGRTPDEYFPHGSSEIADEYSAELDGSPFSYPSLEYRRHFIPQSQHAAEEMWRSFINDAKVHHAGNGSGAREDALQKLTVNGNMLSTRQPERLHVPSSQPSRYSASSEMPQTDSGYCSYASLTGTPAHDVCLETRDNPIPSSQVLASPSPQAVETVRSSARSSFRIPIRKLQKQRPKSQPPPVNIITGYHELTDASIPRIPSVIAVRHAKRLSQFPLLEHTFPSLQHTTADRTLSPVQTYDAPIRFPSPANALEAASAPSRSFPTASSKPRASTIVVEDDEWGASDLVRSPSWSEFGGGGRRTREQKKLAKAEKGNDKRLLKEEKEFGKRLQKDRKDLEKQIKKDEHSQRSTRSRSASRTGRRSSEGQSRHDTMVTISDFGTVTESLGNSPYDIATSMLPNPRNVNDSRSNRLCDGATSTLRKPQNARIWHPHQISTAMPRPKSAFGSRIRSQTVFLDIPSVPALAAVDLKAHNLEWPRDRQRSQSFSAVRAKSFNDPGGIPGKLIRTHSMMEDTPPVPALPSARQVKQREAEIIRSRPHSMIVESPASPVPTPTSRECEGQRTVPYPSESGTSAIPRNTRGSKIVPDLWSNGSLERKNPKAVERSRQATSSLTCESDEALPAKDNVWETQSHAWSARRKSAGEALLRNQVRDVFDSQEAAHPVPLYEHSDRPTSLTRAFTSGANQAFTPTPSHLGPFPNPLASHPHLSAQKPTPTWDTPISHHQSTAQQTQRCGSSLLGSPLRPSVSSFQHENQPPTSTPRRAQTQSFQIQRKRVGSGSSATRAENATGVSLYEGVLV